MMAPPPRTRHPISRLRALGWTKRGLLERCFVLGQWSSQWERRLGRRVIAEPKFRECGERDAERLEALDVVPHREGDPPTGS
jgi:hypothetical protein